MRDTVKIDSKSTKMIAHRGLSSIERQNTAAAFVAAGNRAKYFGIESDVRRTKDGKYVMIHDPGTGGVCATDVSVAGSTYDELRSLVLFDNDSENPRRDDRCDIRIPSLREYIMLCKKYGKMAILELKDGNMMRDELLDIIKIIRDEDYLSHVIFIDFCLNNLIMLRTILPDQPAQWLLNYWNDDIFGILEKYNLGLDAAYPIVTKEIIDRVHSMGLEVNVWTVDDPEIGNKMVEYGVDYITSNRLE